MMRFVWQECLLTTRAVRYKASRLGSKIRASSRAEAYQEAQMVFKVKLVLIEWHRTIRLAIDGLWSGQSGFSI